VAEASNKMKRKVIEIPSVEDLLKTSEETAEYYKEWNRFYSQHGREPEDAKNVVRKPEHVMISKVWQYKDYPIVRAAVIKPSWLPYEPPQPFWNPKQNYIEIFEQFYGAGKRKIAETLHKKHYGRGKDAEIYARMYKHIFHDQRVVLEGLFMEKGRRKMPIRVNEFVSTRDVIFEDIVVNYYNLRNELLATYVTPNVILTLRDYEVLYEETLKGHPQAKDKLKQEIISRDKNYLKTIGRIPNISKESLLKKVDALQTSSKFDERLLQQLEDFFSLVDTDYPYIK